MKPKHLIRALKKYAKLHTKEQQYWAIEKTFQPFFDEESQEWKKGIAVLVNVNHARRVKRVYKKYGINAAMAYLTVYKKEENQNEKDNTCTNIPSTNGNNESTNEG